MISKSYCFLNIHILVKILASVDDGEKEIELGEEGKGGSIDSQNP